MNAPEVNNPEAQVNEAQPEEEKGNTWQRLVNAVVACQQAGEMPQGDPVILGVYLWSLVHGLAELWRSGPLSLMPQAAEGLEPMARKVLMAALGSMEAAAEKNDGASWRPCTKEESQ
jgi:hypothetical protein